MDPLLSPQVNLAIQVIILFVLFASLALKGKRKYIMHGVTMLIGVILNVISFLLVMLPSLLSLEIVRTDPLSMISIFSILHGSLGVITGVFALWLVGSWHLQSSTANCIKRKKMMRTTLTLWLGVLFLGFVLYYLLYGF